jgi:hypothetical protein
MVSGSNGPALAGEARAERGSAPELEAARPGRIVTAGEKAGRFVFGAGLALFVSYAWPSFFGAAASVLVGMRVSAWALRGEDFL